MRIAILHDTFMYKGGAERLVLLAAKALKADVITAWRNPESFDPAEFGLQGRFVELGKPRANKWLRQASLRNRMRRKTHCLRSYDVVVFSGDCLDAVRHLRPGALAVYYCHTPPRYLFDQAEAYEKKVPKWLRAAYRATTADLRESWLGHLARMKIVITNSINTAQRLKNFSGRESVIIHPPVDSEFFSPDTTVPKGNYYVSFARLASVKRVDSVVRAFSKMPHKNLVLTYGQNDPQKEEILRLAQGISNITTKTDVSDQQLRTLIRGATANVYVPRDEDFGMNPIESMACGIPVIGVAEGGILETITHQKTGLLLPADFSEKDLCDAVQKLDQKTADSMAAACRQAAMEFSYPVFVHKLKTALKIN